MNSITTGIFTAFEWCLRIIKLNVIWFAACLVGVVVFTVFPATGAAFKVTNEWVKGNGELSIWNTFKEAFKKYFWKSQVIGYGLVLASFILVIDIRLFLSLGNSLFMQAIVVVLTVLFFILALVSLFLFPVMVEGERPLKAILTHAFFTAVSYIHWTLLNLFGLVALVLVTIRFPAAFFFLTMAGSILWLSCMHQIIKQKIETKYDKLHSTLK